MSTLWTMPISEIEKKRDELQGELDVHEDNTITQLGGFEEIRETYVRLIDRYNTEIKSRD